MAGGNGGILSRVIKAREAREDFIKVLVHGHSGTGKSTICGTAPRPILYLWTERQGVVSFKRVAPDEDTLQVDSLDTLRQVLDQIRSNNPGYATVALDSLSEMQRLIIDEVTARTPGKEHPTREDWRSIIERTAALVRAYRALPMNVVVTALSDEKVVGEERIVRPALSGQKLPGQLSQYFNVVGYCFKIIKGDEVVYRVLLEGRDDFTCKGLPGLRYREEPDIGYWFGRAFKDAPARDPGAKMMTGPQLTAPESPPSASEPAEPELAHVPGEVDEASS